VSAAVRPSPVLLEVLPRLVEEGLAQAVGPGEPAELYEAARYVLEGGGKRLRPMLTLLAAEHYGLHGQHALGPALAVEIFHNFTLVHDDIMDRADTRRGRPTVHRRWDEPTAILVGDLLMGIAYEMVMRGPAETRADAWAVFSPMVRRLCEGQMLDMAFARRTDVSAAEYMDMIDRKTGALLACSLELGATAAGAGEGDRTTLRRVGIDLGRAFQIQDDLLDLTASSASWGKPVGGDLIEGKRTWLLLTALERAEGEDRDAFERVLRGEVGEAGVDDVRRRMEKLGVLADTRTAVIFHAEAALSGLATLDETGAQASLQDVVRGLAARTN
jgi:geranylgeranyl diphosphate synthase type II